MGCPARGRAFDRLLLGCHGGLRYCQRLFSRHPAPGRARFRDLLFPNADHLREGTIDRAGARLPRRHQPRRRFLQRDSRAAAQWRAADRGDVRPGVRRRVRRPGYSRRGVRALRAPARFPFVKPMAAEIDLRDVHLRFRVRPVRRASLKEYLVRGLYRPSANPPMNVHALRGITLRRAEGERLGIVGHNGAGKSTLLKVIAGIYPPTSGFRRITGRICSLFDIMIGFEMEASGRDNIRFRSFLQGETPYTIRDKMDAIAEFSELERFLDVPLKYYSAGMLVRLAFSIASATEPEVLLIDEALAAGDLSFRAKARRRVNELMESARLMVLISHDLKTLAEVCTSVAWLERGQIR